LKKSLILIFVFLSFGGFAQDPIFTQFYANPLYLNPALTGSDRCPRAVMNYRNQWPALDGQFITYSASYDQHVDVLSGGLGVLIMNDRAGNGTLNTLNASLLYSYELPVTREFAIRAGAQVTYFQKSVDWSRLTFGDMIDPRYGFIYPTAETPVEEGVNGVDFSAGLVGFTRDFYAGVAFHHLTEPNQSFLVPATSVLPMKLTAHAGWNIPMNKRYPDEAFVSPNILYQRQGNPFGTTNAEQLFLGVYVKKGPIVGGLWHRLGDAVTVLVGVQTDALRFGYSYDITTSALNSTAGSHEISVALNFDCKPKRKKYRPLNCPKF
jgi:type IX secretion system PorP/SprF family membrane protein